MIRSSTHEEVAMQVLRVPPRHHANATVTCPPLRWRAVRRASLTVAAVAVIGSAALVFTLSAGRPFGALAAVTGAVVILVWSAACAAGIAHVVRRTCEPVVFRVARGELTVSWPFLFTRRTRVVRTSDVTAVVASVTGTGAESGPARRPTARLVIRRRHRRPIRVPGARPVEEVTRAAEELRAVLHV
jgi:hypothetical protein